MKLSIGDFVFKDGALTRVDFAGGFADMTGSSPALFFLTDHLGSVRAVIDGNASTAAYPLAGFYSIDDYAPYGTKSTSSASSYLSLASTGTTVSLRDGFTGKENQGPDFSIGYIDFGARQYSPSISRWLVPDPMGEKYYDVSPYVYCGGDPVNLVDPDGRRLYFAPGVSDKFKKQFAATIKYMNSKGTADNISKLEASNNVYYIDEAHSVTNIKFSRNSKTIYWDPNHLIETSSNMWISPATSLDHEASHAVLFDNYSTGKMSEQEKKEYISRRQKNSDSQYDTKEERFIITNREQKTARKHGEISDMQVTRADHKIKQVTGSVSEKNPDEIEKIIWTNNSLL